MLYRLAADTVVLIHLGFIIFVVGGGFLAWRWRWLAWVHVPAAVWGTLLELAGWICPLTPLENNLRFLAGEVGYRGGFIDHYLIPVIYPTGLTHGMQLTLGTFVLLLNAIAYTVYFRLRRDS